MNLYKNMPQKSFKTNITLEYLAFLGSVLAKKFNRNRKFYFPFRLPRAWPIWSPSGSSTETWRAGTSCSPQQTESRSATLVWWGPSHRTTTVTSWPRGRKSLSPGVLPSPSKADSSLTPQTRGCSGLPSGRCSPSGRNHGSVSMVSLSIQNRFCTLFKVGPLLLTFKFEGWSSFHNGQHKNMPKNWVFPLSLEFFAFEFFFLDLIVRV